jgi:hypothetical protein
VEADARIFMRNSFRPDADIMNRLMRRAMVSVAQGFSPPESKIKIILTTLRLIVLRASVGQERALSSTVKVRETWLLQQSVELTLVDAVYCLIFSTC